MRSVVLPVRNSLWLVTVLAAVALVGGLGWRGPSPEPAGGFPAYSFQWKATTSRLDYNFELRGDPTGGFLHADVSWATGGLNWKSSTRSHLGHVSPQRAEAFRRALLARGVDRLPDSQPPGGSDLRYVCSYQEDGRSPHRLTFYGPLDPPHQALLLFVNQSVIGRNFEELLRELPAEGPAGRCE